MPRPGTGMLSRLCTVRCCAVRKAACGRCRSWPRSFRRAGACQRSRRRRRVATWRCSGSACGGAGILGTGATSRGCRRSSRRRMPLWTCRWLLVKCVAESGERADAGELRLHPGRQGTEVRAGTAGEGRGSVTPWEGEGLSRSTWYRRGGHIRCETTNQSR